MTRPRLLDLFCCQGGAAMGYHRAGFDVVGVDVAPQPRYPFEFIQADALEYLTAHGHEFDAIHASPPCQAHTSMRHAWNAKQHEDLISFTRAILQRAKHPRWVIENVPGAPLRTPVTLCGSMFGLGAVGYQLRRHRLFESNAELWSLPCAHRLPVVGVYGGHARDRRKRAGRDFSGRDSVAIAREAMGIDWMTLGGLSQAVPPAMTRFIGEQLLASLEAAA